SACGAFQVSSSVIQFNFIYIAPKHLSQSLNASVTASYTEIKPHLHSLFLAHTASGRRTPCSLPGCPRSAHTHTHTRTRTRTHAHTHTHTRTHTHTQAF